ncbi:MAG TPA: insulinase family protein [Saprospiraceae bacterium]|nr:insulinase family protein [Saprospiraceae bacterium]
MRAQLLLFFFTLIPVLLISQPLPFDPEVVSGELDNGLKYYIKQNNKPENRVELRLAIKAGSLLEDEDQLGLAHFVEHMAFNGTEHFKKNELVDFLELSGTRFGADLNAYTSFEETVYQLQARTDSTALLDQAILILSDWASGLRFDSNEIEKERGVVIAEWRNRLSPDQRLQQQFYPVLFQDSRYAERLPIGDPKIIEQADQSTIQRFYKDWYRPELMAIIAVGDIDPSQMEKRIKEQFETLKNPEKPRKRKEYRLPFHEGTRSITATDPEAPFTQIRLLIKQAALGDSTKSDFAERLKISLYNTMLGARMYELQQTANPPFTFATTAYSRNLGDTDVYNISAFVGAEQALAGFESVYRETIRAQQYGFTSTELERAKENLLTRAQQREKERANIPSGSLAAGLVSHFLKDSPVLSPEQYLELVEELLPTIDLSTINVLPQKWITTDNRSLIVTGPEKVKDQLPSPEEIEAAMQKIENSRLAPYIDQMANQALFEKELQAGTVLGEKTYEGLGVTEWKLSNGLTLVMKPTDFKEDEILIEAFSPGGHSLVDSSRYQSAMAATTLANLSGLSQFSAPDLLKKLSGRVVNISPYISEYEEGLNGNAATNDLETLLQLTHLYFTDPRFSSTSLDGYRQRQANILKNITDNPYYYFAKVQSKVKYQNHPRRQGIPTMADLAKIDLAVAETFYKDRFADASDFTFLLVGNFEPAAIRPLLLKYLGSLPAKDREETYRPLDIELTPGIVDTVIQRGQAPKALVDITFHGDFSYTPEKRYHFASMLAVLRIKMREQLREELGGVYGVRLNGTNSRIPDPKYRITISFNTDPGELDTLVQTAFRVIRELQSQGPEEKDVEKVKETQIQSRLKAEKENSYWMAQLRYRYKNNMPMSGATTEAFRTKVEALSAKDIQKAARQYFDFEQRIKLVLLPES